MVDAENTLALAEALARHWQICNDDIKPRTWYLEGDLGAGKTTFSQAFIKTLMRDATLRVKSPTYTLIESYESDTADCRVLHADLYRLVEAEELEYLGYRDLEMHADIVLVEWPDKALGILQQADIVLALSILEHGRYLTISTSSPAVKIWLAGFVLE